MSSKLEVADSPHPAEPKSPNSQQLLGRIARSLERKPFRPFPWLGHSHSQTIAAHVWPRRFGLRSHRSDEARIFEVEPNVRLLAHCRWHGRRTEHATMLLVHGLEGSSTSIYMLGTAEKAFRAGFNIIRLNMRNCGGTEDLTPTLYNSGLSGDLRTVVRELRERDLLGPIFLVGFSMSGNMSLKLAGEMGEAIAGEVAAICAVSPLVDLHATADALERRSNRIYERNFIKSLHRRVRRKRKFYPALYDTAGLGRVRTIREFDERYTSVDGGYTSADDYYTRASARPLLKRIRIPTLIIHAQDDPFVPFHPLCDSSVRENPFLLLLAPPAGGHVGFVSARQDGEDRFWAENRVVEFCRLVRDLPSLDDVSAQPAPSVVASGTR